MLSVSLIFVLQKLVYCPVEFMVLEELEYELFSKDYESRVIERQKDIKLRTK